MYTTTTEEQAAGYGQRVDVTVTILELDDIAPFWMRGYRANRTFGDLYQDCLNHPDVLQSRRSLARVKASRHFWCGERMMLRSQPIAAALPQGAGALPPAAAMRPAGVAPPIATPPPGSVGASALVGAAAPPVVIPAGAGEARGTISVVLRPDYYRVGPPQYAAPGIEYTYLDTEAPIRQLITQILNRDERACCFDLCSARNRRLNPERTLASYGMLPAWPDRPAAEFPERAALRLRPRTSWSAYALYLLAALLGFGIGYGVLRALL